MSLKKSFPNRPLRVRFVRMALLLSLALIVSAGPALGANVAQKAHDAKAKAALLDLAHAMDSYFAAHGSYTTKVDDLKAEGYRPGEVKVKIIFADDQAYKASARHPQGSREFVYDSTRGGLQ